MYITPFLHSIFTLHLYTPCTSLFVAYVELNYTGFQKILKKYEKVTGFKLKQVYMSNIVDLAFPFKSSNQSNLDHSISTSIALYSNLTYSTLKDSRNILDLQLKEKLIWERNSIWKDMVEKERKTTTMLVEESLVKHDLPITIQLKNIFGMNLFVPVLSMQCIKCTFVFIILLILANANMFGVVF